MKVKITKCSSIDYWYFNKINEVHDVTYDITLKKYRVNSNMELCIDVDDCETVADQHTHGQDRIKELADAIVNQFTDYVHGYVGSSMLTNTEYPEQIERQATKVAIITVEQTIKELKNLENSIDSNGYYEIAPNLKIELVYSILQQEVILNELKSRL